MNIAQLLKKGKFMDGQFVKGMIPWNKGKKCVGMGMTGKKHSEGTRKKISLSKKGNTKTYVRTEEHRRIASLIGRNKKTWNKGKKGLQILSAETRKKLSESLKGKRAWNKGLPAPWAIGNKHAVGHTPPHKDLTGFARTDEYKNMMQRKRRDKNPEKVRVMNHNRRIRTDDLTVATVQRVYEENIKKHGTLTCYLCLNPILFKKDHLEHKIPLSRGGKNLHDNLDVACQSCNCKKSNKTLTEFLKSEVPK